MEKKQKLQYSAKKEEQQGENPSLPPQDTTEKDHEEEASLPGVEVVRTNTPRPLSSDILISGSGYWQAMQTGEPAPTFPARAPSAPPLPEELDDEALSSMTTPAPVATSPIALEETPEFAWLFEYGLYMDPSILSAEHLEGQALAYGPAMLKGYKLMLGAYHQQGIEGQGASIFAIVADDEPEAELWGVLYRVPRRLLEKRGEEPSVLDTVHLAVPPQQLFQGVQVKVRESYRDQDVPCLTYVATEIAGQQLHLVAIHQWDGEPQIIQRLTAIARKQKLPESYINHLLVAATPAEEQAASDPETPSIQIPQIPPSALPPSVVSDASVNVLQRNEAGLLPHGDQDTDPLPAFQTGTLEALQSQELPKTSPQTFPASGMIQGQGLRPQKQIQRRRLMIFALYLVVLVVVILVFAVLQGLGPDWGWSFDDHLTVLGVPWLVMMYGLLGGCVSCLATLGRMRAVNLPHFVVIVWFTRPFVGALLALFAVVFLTSGLFVFGDYVQSHIALLWLVGALAGSCENWLFASHR